MPIPTYVINLERAPGRLRYFTEQAKALGLPFERIEAVDGEKLTDAELKAQCSAPVLHPLRPSEIGCAMSHRLAWQKLCESGAPWGVVFEDDVVISPDYPRIMSDLGWIPPGADVVKIEAWPGRKIALSRPLARVDGRTVHRLKGLSYGCGGYAISRQAAGRLLADRGGIGLPLDHYLYDPISDVFGRLFTCMMVPALCVQGRLLPHKHRPPELVDSTIGKHTPAKTTMPFWKKLQRELQRQRSRLRNLFSLVRVVEWR